MLKLNVGCFTTQFGHDWRNSDILDLRAHAHHHGFLFSQWSIEDEIPYNDGIVDLIFAMHVLEHVTYEAGARFLKECHRVMKPGGVLRILVPDAWELCGSFRDGSLEKYDKFSDTSKARKHGAQKLWELLCEGGHKSLYDFETLRTALYEAGFRVFDLMPFGVSRSPVMQAETKDLYPGLSLIVEAVR
jgi:predicted SAM-dependent methyltransferase